MAYIVGKSKTITQAGDGNPKNPTLPRPETASPHLLVLSYLTPHAIDSVLILRECALYSGKVEVFPVLVLYSLRAGLLSRGGAAQLGRDRGPKVSACGTFELP